MTDDAGGKVPAIERPVRRPFALLALAGLLLLKAGLLLGVVLDVHLAADNPVRNALRVSPELGQFLDGPTLTNIALIVLAALLLGSAVGLVLLRRDGWLLAMVLTGLFVAADIAGFLGGDVSYFWMALNIVTVFYLNQTDVRSAVGVSTEPLVPVVTMP